MEDNKDINNAEQLNDDQLDNANGGFFPESIRIPTPDMILDPCTYYNPERNYISGLCSNCPHFTHVKTCPNESIPYCGKAEKFFGKVR